MKPPYPNTCLVRAAEPAWLRHVLGRTAAAALVACCGLASPAAGAGRADQLGSSATSAPVDPADITGRDFAGIQFDAAAGAGVIDFAAKTATVWSERPVGGVPGGPDVMRLLLAGDVRVRLGFYTFSAARAVVWLQPLTGLNPAAGADEYQVFVYFDRVGTPEADAAVSTFAPRLPVRGVFKLSQPIALKVDMRLDGRPDDELVREGELVLGRYLRGVAAGEIAPGDDVAANVPRRPDPRLGGPFIPGQARPYPTQPQSLTREDIRRLQENLPPAEVRQPIFAKEGVLSFSGGEITIVQGDAVPAGMPEADNAVMISGGVVVQYTDPSRDRTIQISAERAVVFLGAGRLDEMLSRLSRLQADEVQGIYLEGDVLVTDNQYSLRAPRAYYDIKKDRALLIDAVFWTYDQRRRMPLYVRAKTIRQEADGKFFAGSARITNSSFFEPHLAIGASDVTLTRQEIVDAGGQSRDRYVVDARDITLRAGAVPFFYWPRYVGDPSTIPLRDVRVENSSGSGTGVKTTWDFFGLLGMSKPDGVTTDLRLDYYVERGPALGTDLSWERPDFQGSLFAYAVPDDRGEDVLKSGARRERDGEFRGTVFGEHRWALSDRWTLFAEGSYISDENFLDAFFEPLTEERREFTSGLYARRLEDNSILAVQARGSFNDFIVNDYLLQSQGYSVSKLPEASYARVADDLLPAVAPGRLQWFSEYRIGSLSQRFNSPTASELGFTNDALAQEAVGTQANQSLEEALTLAGLTDDSVGRVDTRQEFSSKLDAGPLRFTPFLVGRGTAYDRDFESFSGNNDQGRLWGAAGVNIATEFQRVDDSVESRLLDLHRTRHIIEPGATLWTAGTNLRREDLPVYDEQVESISEGTAYKLSLNQIWQTQRGGPGRWRSVDVFTLRTEYIDSTSDTDVKSPIGRFFDSRPELSNLGEYAQVDAAWQVSDALALSTLHTYDFMADQPARTVVGGTIEHSPTFSSYAELRYLNEQDSTLVGGGFNYLLGKKYALNTYLSYDTDLGTVQNVSVDLRRRFPNAILGLGVSYDNLTSETSFGFVFQPVVRDDQLDRVRAVQLGGAR